MVDFDRWFQAPEQQLEALEKLLPELCPSPGQRQQALALIDPQHRRSLRPQQVPKLSVRVRRLHRRLLRLARRRHAEPQQHRPCLEESTVEQHDCSCRRSESACLSRRQLTESCFLRHHLRGSHWSEEK